METLRFSCIFSVMFIAFIALTGCDRAQTLMGGVPTEPAPSQTTPDMQTSPVKSVWLIDYPEGGKEAYLEWIASVAETLSTPEEVLRIRSYDNVDPEMSPNRLVEFEFSSFLDAAAYSNRPEITALSNELPNHVSDATVYTFIQRSAYSTGEGDNWSAKGILLIDYPLGGKETYLEWVASIGATLVSLPELKATASYDNYYGETPHRLVEFEFASQADADAYEAAESIMAIEAELDTRTRSWEGHRFELRSDYQPSVLSTAPAKRATATIGSSNDSGVTGMAVFRQNGDQITLTIEIQGAVPGLHAVHIHANGDCSAPDGTSAGGHWNPTGVAHGKWGEGEFHLGDIGNITVGEDGTGSIELTTDLWEIGTGADVDVVGKSIIVHAGADDFTSQPSGAAGARIGCGIIVLAE